MARSRRRRRWDVLASLCQRIDARIVVELGVLRGATLRHLLADLPDVHVIAVDTWIPGRSEFEPAPGEKNTPADNGYRAYAGEDLEGAYVEVLDMAREFSPRAHVWRMDMLAAAEDMPPAAVDLVFHDADHTAQQLELAIKAWLPAIRPGGLVVGHDYDMPSVRSVIDRLCPAWRAEHDSMWWVTREEVMA